MAGSRLCKSTWPAAVLRRGFRRIALVSLLTLLTTACQAPRLSESYPVGRGTLTVALEGFRNDRGRAIVSLFAGPKGFPDEVPASVATASVAVHEGRATAVFPGLPYRDYAVSVLHDEDNDGQMATGLIGTPREGFGFSGFPDFRFGHPDYDHVRFLLIEPQREMTVVIHYETARRQHRDEGRAAGARRPVQE